MIEWNVSYAIHSEVMTFTDNVGRQRAVLGYPVTEIKRAIQGVER